MSTIEELISYAASLAGLTADPATPWRREYLSLIAPGETPHRQAEMATAFGCALVARGILRRFIQHPILDAPYRDTHAVSDLMVIAREAHAVRPIAALPCPGDIVIVSPPEHVWFVLRTVASKYDGVTLLEGIDGVEVDGFRGVVAREHLIRNGRDDAGGDRAIVAVIDCGKVLQRFGLSSSGPILRAPL